MNYIGQQKAEELYSELLGSDEEFLESLKLDAEKAGQGIKTDIRLHSVDNNGTHTPFDLYIPKYAITGVVARTGGGKTTLLTNLAVRMTMSGASGLYVTLEEPAFAITAKMLASYSAYKNQSYSMNAITTGEAIKTIAGKSVVEDMAGFKKDVLRLCRPIDANKLIDKEHLESPTLLYQPQYIADIIAYVNAGMGENNLDFVLIDFGQLLETVGANNDNSYQRMKAVMMALKNLAGTGIAVVIGAQMKREVASEWVFDWQPEAIRDGSDLEQACSMIIAIGRDQKQKDIDQRDVIRLLKNRNGRKRVGGMTTIDFEHNFIPTLTEQPTEKAL